MVCGVNGEQDQAMAEDPWAPHGNTESPLEKKTLCPNPPGEKDGQIQVSIA